MIKKSHAKISKFIIDLDFLIFFLAPNSFANSLHLPNERFSPVRRASDGLANLHKYQSHLEKIYNQTISQSGSRHNSQSSLKQLQQECQELQVIKTPMSA